MRRVRRVAEGICVALFLAACKGDGPPVPTTFAPTGGSTIAMTGVVAATVSTAPQVQILDAKGKGIKGLRVRWKVGTNSGGVANDSTLTDISGTASSGGWTLGTAAGLQTLTASADGVSPVTFTANVAPGPVANLVRQSLDAQTATVNTTVPIAPSVRAQDAFGNAVPGTAVSFTATVGGGSVVGGEKTTDQNGIATATSWKLGTTAGSQEVRASAAGSTLAFFAATALPGPPADIVKAVGDLQSGVTGRAIGTAPGARVLDAFGNGVGNVPVTFTPGANSGSVTNGTVSTDPSNGVAIVGSWILGTAPSQTLTATAASIPGKSVTFSASVTESAFNLEVRFIGTGGTDRQRLAFSRAAAKWQRVIVGHVHDVAATIPAADCRPWIPAINETLHDVVIYARIAPIDGVNNVLGQSNICYIGSISRLSLVGFMEFDEADLPSLEASGEIDNVVLHEMGHVLGIGTLWAFKGFVAGTGTADPTFTGAGARTQFIAANLQTYGGALVPIHNEGPAGRREAHWRYPMFGQELMNPFAFVSMPLSRITAASLADLGYTVNLAACDAYSFSAAISANPFAKPATISLENDIATDVVIKEILPNGSRRPIRQP